MLKDRNIICISSIDWDFVWQGHQEIMSTFARHGNRVLFIENTGVRSPSLTDFNRIIKRVRNWYKSVKGFKEVQENVYTFSPIVLPFPFSKTARWINKSVILSSIKRWMNVVGFYDPIIWTFLPTGLALDITNGLDKKLLVYYCIADFEQLAGDSKKIKLTEEKLIRSCDLVFAQGKLLQEKCAKLNKNVTIFPFGVKIEAFESFKESENEVPDDIKNIKKPIVGYIGGIHRHIDFSLIKYIAEKQPDWSIVFVGPIQTNISMVSSLPNIFFLGKKEFTGLPHYIYTFDVCMIPYLETEYTKTVYPTKMNEYHAMGKPVVSTRLPEVVEFNKRNNNIAMLAGTKDEFVNYLNEAINNENEELYRERIKAAKVNSWSNRIEEMSNIIEETISVKPRSVNNKWQKKLLETYKLSKKLIILPCFIIILLWILIYHTPLIWVVAYPLKIVDAPKHADAIAVFGGGVGETGSFGQSTIERARYGAELYNKDYAENIIFSSGYTAVYNDAENMKLIAASLGVPESSIILEQKANSAYENVQYVSMIMEEHGWNSVLIVSSPYNMLRVSLVFKRFNEINNIVYTPVLNSQFYNKENRENFRPQIKAIFHEYLGIVYYWWKGYI